MILKTLTHDHEGSDTWNWYDNIESASAYFDVGANCSVVSVIFHGVPGFITFVIEDVAYLCNDKGETIERLRGHRHDLDAVTKQESECPDHVT